MSFPSPSATCRKSGAPRSNSYRAKRGQWLAWLDTDEHHAIWSAISAMVWTDVSFRTLVQIATDNEKSSLSNTLIAEQITLRPRCAASPGDPQACRQNARHHVVATADF